MFKIALCQMPDSQKKDMVENKKETWEKASSMVREAAAAGAKIVSLPEMWDCPYTGNNFREYAEPADGQTVQKMSALAKELGIYLVGGSISEIDPATDKVYNTSFIFDPQGTVIGRHRKMHLFDIDVKERVNADGTIKPAMYFKESNSLTPGDSDTVVDVKLETEDGTEEFKLGVAICFDVRFPEHFRRMTLAGARLVILPASFNLTTGPAHWDLAMRSRAVDNQIYFAACSPSRNMASKYHSYGHSCVVTPWGDFAGKLDEKEGICYADIDLSYVDVIRDELPLLKTLEKTGGR